MSLIQRSFTTLQYYTGTQNGVLIIEVSAIQRFVIKRFHCICVHTIITYSSLLLWHSWIDIWILRQFTLCTNHTNSNQAQYIKIPQLSLGFTGYTVNIEWTLPNLQIEVIFITRTLFFVPVLCWSICKCTSGLSKPL